MSKRKVHEFVNHIYPRRLFVVKGNVSEQWLNTWFKQEFVQREVVLLVSEEASACVYDGTIRYMGDNKLGVLVLITDKLSTSYIAHEAVHAASEFYEQIGATFDYKNQEPFAYLVGWCADCIDQVNRNKFKD